MRLTRGASSCHPPDGGLGQDPRAGVRGFWQEKEAAKKTPWRVKARQRWKEEMEGHGAAPPRGLGRESSCRWAGQTSFDHSRGEQGQGTSRPPLESRMQVLEGRAGAQG